MSVELPVIQPWFSDGLQFECNGCGDCCTGETGFVWINEVEIARAAEYLKTTPEEFAKAYCRKVYGRVSLKEKRPNAKGEYDCIFLRAMPAEPGPDGKPHVKRICDIYPVRPLQCRTFPFWEGPLDSRKDWDRTGMTRCPGINIGRKWTAQEIISRRDASDWPKDQP